MQVIIDFLIAVKNISSAFLLSWLQFLAPPKPKCVKGEIVLITGAGSGMGQQLAIEFATLGAIVILWDINQKGLKETVQKITEVDGKCHSYVCDVSKRAEVKLVGECVREEVGEITILVNNAGVVVGKKLLELTDDEVERTFKVNLFAQIWTTKQFLPSMLENNHGHIVNMGSSCGLIGLTQLTDYSASKFGVVGFTQGLSYEIHFSGYDAVYTTLVNPSYVTTKMFQGCTMAYPSILPALELKPTVDRIMQAILTNQKEVCIPRMVYIMSALKTMIPVSAMLEVIRFFKADKFMDSFIGREDRRPSLMKED